MAQYYRVSPNFWKGRQDWSDREKLLAQYFLSCPHRNLEGLYWLPLEYIAADLGWKPSIVRECLATIEGDDFAKYDEDARVLFVCRALSFQAPSTPKQVIGAMSSLEKVPKTVLWAPFVAACEEWAPKLADAIRVAGGFNRNAIPMRSESDTESDPDIARTLSSNSNSSSKPPSPPRGNRKREVEAFQEQLNSWAAVTYPDCDQVAVTSYAARAISQGAETWDAVVVEVEKWHAPARAAA